MAFCNWFVIFAGKSTVSVHNESNVVWDWPSQKCKDYYPLHK
jgi:hypothetical protein